MRKKIAGQLLIFCLLFLAWWYTVQQKALIPASGLITGPLPVFPQVQVNLLQSKNPVLVEDAVNETSRALLRYIVPDLAGEPWQKKHLFLDMFGDKEPELVFAFSLPPDRGILAVIQKQNSRYVLCCFIDDLLPVGRIDQVAGPEGKDILITREDHNERTGAYSESQTLKLWTWQKNKPETAWEEQTFWELNLLNTWYDPQTRPAQWYKLIQELTVTMQAAPSCQVRVEGEQRFFCSPAGEKETLPAPYHFDLVSARNIQANYQWDKEWRRFILSAGTLDQPGAGPQTVVILRDMEKHLESMVLPWQKQFYQVLTREGQIILAKKEQVKPAP
ncbi:MAG: hypothetical protein QHH10_03270 [Peptococcaceae bacterium]|jgi:hypothetical protein|nr:hypothetical protein [Peptococcaceae bacterium]MDH7524317.1 hypothetical protein [Peptococcaceae bacterium]